MKSLEIVKSKCYKEMNGHYVIFDLTEEEKNTIEQDLEVLEIIRKKKVDIKLLISDPFIMSNEKILEIYNKNMRLNYLNGEKYQLTLEELLKLKQWLEVNENE